MTDRKRRFGRNSLNTRIRFLGFDGVVCDGNIVAILRRGIRINYFVPSVGRECQTDLQRPRQRRASRRCFDETTTESDGADQT